MRGQFKDETAMLEPRPVIMFRGMGINDEWYNGYVYFTDDGAFIFNGENEPVQVKRSTVGMVTPFKEIQGELIFEGDILEETVIGTLFEVVFTYFGNFGLKALKNQPETETLKDFHYDSVDPSYVCTTLLLIGNIHTGLCNQPEMSDQSKRFRNSQK